MERRAETRGPSCAPSYPGRLWHSVFKDRGCLLFAVTSESSEKDSLGLQLLRVRCVQSSREPLGEP